MEEKYVERLTKVEERASSNTHRLNEQDALLKCIYELSASVKVMATELKTLTSKVSKVEVDMEVIKNKPNQLLDKMVDKVITGVIGAVVGAIMALILV